VGKEILKMAAAYFVVASTKGAGSLSSTHEGSVKREPVLPPAEGVAVPILGVGRLAAVGALAHA